MVRGVGHQRGYVCFIEEIGGRPVAAGDHFSAAYAVGWFDSIQDMCATADEHKGAVGLALSGAIEVGDNQWALLSSCSRSASPQPTHST